MLGPSISKLSPMLPSIATLEPAKASVVASVVESTVAGAKVTSVVLSLMELPAESSNPEIVTFWTSL